MKAKVGHFLVLGLREIAGEKMAMLKAYNPENDQVARGQLALPVEILEVVGKRQTTKSK